MLEKYFVQLLEWAATPWGPLVLILHSYFESFVLPLPHDPILMTVALADPSYSFVYASMSTLASALGLTTGYTFGRLTRRTTISKKIRANRHFIEIEALIHRFHRWATFIACFTPIPDKLYCAIAGIVKLDFTNFILIGLLARACRFFLVAGLIYFFGDMIRDWILHSMKGFLILCAACVAALYLSTKFFYRFLDKKLDLENKGRKSSRV